MQGNARERRNSTGMIRRIALACALMAAMTVVGGPARAFDGRGCGGLWTKKTTCYLVLKGSPLLVRGDSEATNASVHVFVTIDGYPELPPILECSATGSGFASCEKSFPSDTTKENLPDQLAAAFVRLDCNVEGAGSGQYYCLAGQEPGT